VKEGGDGAKDEDQLSGSGSEDSGFVEETGRDGVKTNGPNLPVIHE